MDLGPVRFHIFSYSVFRPMPALSTPAVEAAGVGEPTIRGLHQTERTLLCRWMVYSRATTSSMALRPAPALPAAGLLDLGGIVGDVERKEIVVAGRWQDCGISLKFVFDVVRKTLGVLKASAIVTRIAASETLSHACLTTGKSQLSYTRLHHIHSLHPCTDSPDATRSDPKPAHFPSAHSSESAQGSPHQQCR